MVTSLPVALISGANKGLGFETARGLARAGYHVLLGSRDMTLGEAAAASLHDEGTVEAFALDVTDDASIAAAAADIEARFGRLDVLVNNAGVASDDRSGGLPTRAAMAATFDVNVFGVAALTGAMVPLLAKSAHPRVVIVSSGLGSLTWNSDPASPYAGVKPLAYNASKAAATMLAVIFAARLAPQGIKVNAADPGYCATDLNGHSGPRTPAQGAAITIHLATLSDEGPTGGFFNDDGVVPW